MSGQSALAQPMEGAEACATGDMECVNRALDDRLRIVIENLPGIIGPISGPILMAPPPPPPEREVTNTTPVLAPVNGIGSQPIAFSRCGKGMKLEVNGASRTRGYMTCGEVTISCMVPDGQNKCEANGTVTPRAAGRCVVAAAGGVPAFAECKSLN
jgi:hypothetical protein